MCPLWSQGSFSGPPHLTKTAGVGNWFWDPKPLRNRAQEWGPGVAMRTPHLGRVKHHTGDFLGVALEGGQDLLRTLVKDDDVFIRPTWIGPK